MTSVFKFENHENHQTILLDPEHYAKCYLNIHTSASGKTNKRILFEGSLQKVLIILPLHGLQCFIFNGIFSFHNHSLSINTYALTPATLAIPQLITAEMHPGNLPVRNLLQNIPAVIQDQPPALDEDLSDWEFLDDSKIEQHLTACLEAAAKRQKMIEEDWVSLDAVKFDNNQRVYLESSRQEINFSGNPNFIEYVIPGLTTCLLDDDTKISFENGKIIPKEHVSINDMASKTLQYLLTSTYGYLLAWSIMNRYQLLKKNSITFEDVKRTLVGISTNVKITDLQELISHIQKKTNDRSMQCSTLLKNEEKDRLQKVSFESLNADQIGILLKAFQTLPFDGTCIPMLDALYQGRSRGLAVWEFDCFNHDTEIAKRLGYIDAVDTEHLQTAISEHICKNLGYLELKPGMIIPMLTEAKKKIFYYIANKLKDKNDGVICYLLAPINQAQDIYSRENPLVLHLKFRGTQWQPGRKDSYESLQRDLDSSGIGKTSFQAREMEIIEMLLTYLRSSNVQWIKIVINGHSLGGTDVQRTIRLLTKLLSQSPMQKEFEKIVAVEAFCHNSPAPESELNYLFAADIKALEKLKRNILINITLVLFATDPLQNAGDMYLGAKIISPLLAKFAVLVQSKSCKYFTAHRLKAFVEPKDPCELTFINANDPDDLLEKIFSRNYYWNTENNTWVQMAAKGLHWYGGYALQPLAHVLYSSIYYGFKCITVFSRTISKQRSEEASRTGWLKKTISVHPSNY